MQGEQTKLRLRGGGRLARWALPHRRCCCVAAAAQQSVSLRMPIHNVARQGSPDSTSNRGCHACSNRVALDSRAAPPARVAAVARALLAGCQVGGCLADTEHGETLRCEHAFLCSPPFVCLWLYQRPRCRPARTLQPNPPLDSMGGFRSGAAVGRQDQVQFCVDRSPPGPVGPARLSRTGCNTGWGVETTSPACCRFDRWASPLAFASASCLARRVRAAGDAPASTLSVSGRLEFAGSKRSELSCSAVRESSRTICD